MKRAPSPPRQEQRLATPAEQAIADAPPQGRFVDLTELAARICEAPIALISLIDRDRHRLESFHGLELEEATRTIAFCAHAIEQTDLLVVPDARLDPRFDANPSVTGKPHIRFCAAYPLLAAEGQPLGALSVMDHQPRELQADQERALRILSRQVMALLELRRNRDELDDVRGRLREDFDWHESARRFRQLAEHVNQVFWMTDAADHEVLYVSPAYEHIWGRPIQELYGHPLRWLEAVHPEDRDRVRDVLAAQTAGRYELEYRVVRPDGSVRWVVDRVFPIPNADGRTYRTAGIVEDISERKRLEQDLRESLAGKRAVWESALDAILTLDREGRIVDLNPAAERMFGRTAQTAVGCSVAELIAPRSLREQHRHALRRYLDTGEAHILGRRMEVAARHADGTEFPAEWTVVAASEAPQPLFVGTIRDLTDSKDAQRALLSERDLSEHIINTLPGVFYIFDHTGRFLRWNRNFETVTGYSADELESLHPLDLFHGNDQAVLEKCLKEVFAGGASGAEASLVSKDGSSTPYYLSGRYIELDGRPCDLGMGIDISALKNAEAERDRLFELSPDLFCVAGFDGYFKQLNPAWEHTLGYRRAELMSRPFTEFVHPDDRQPTRDVLNDLGSNAPPQAFENRYRCRDGSWKWLSWKSIAVPQDREVFYAMARDVTKQKQAADALRASEERYRSLVENARDGIFTLDLVGTITSANHAFEAITGWSREEWIGRPFDAIVHPEDLPAAREIFQTLIAAEPIGIPSYKLRFATRQGDYVPMELTAAAQQIGDEVVGVLGIARDVRERHRMEDELRQIQKLDSIGRLAAGVAHDFNNLLTVQQGYLSLLLTEPGLSESVVDQVREVAAAAERAGALTRQLLLFSRKEAMQHRRFKLDEVVMTLGTMLDRVVGADIALHLDCDDNLPPMVGDPGMMEQVLMNFVVNARDAMPAGGQIMVSTQAVALDASAVRNHPEARAGNFICLTVTDTGQGIAPEIQEKIFDPFFTTKDIGAGTGLGLATVHGIVKQHEGWIEVRSKPDAGTTFRVLIPAAEQSEAASEADHSMVVLRGGSETILVVEDEHTVCRFVESVLERYGYRVLVAEDGVEALKQWSEHGATIDLVLTDVVMPEGMSGWELARRLRAQRPELKLLVMSGYDSQKQDPRPTIARSNADLAFLQKPFGLRELITAVRDCLDEKS